MDRRLEANRRNWDERAPVHAASDFYDVAGFKRGRITLNEIERREVGAVAGRSLLHLQCHFGMDTMSWSRLGAAATGVDFSPAAIALARSLAEEVKLSTRFLLANVYDLPQVLGERFDIVYSATGVLCWLPDLDAWAKVAARHLKPGGTFYLFDGHPALMMFESEGAEAAGVGDLRVRYSYFPDDAGLYFEGGEPSYAGSEPIASGCWEWQHSLAEIFDAVRGAGLDIELFREHSVNCYQAFPGMVRDDAGWWRLPPDQPAVPQTFSLRARKPG